MDPLGLILFPTYIPKETQEPPTIEDVFWKGITPLEMAENLSKMAIRLAPEPHLLPPLIANLASVTENSDSLPPTLVRNIPNNKNMTTAPIDNRGIKRERSLSNDCDESNEVTQSPLWNDGVIQCNEFNMHMHNDHKMVLRPLDKSSLSYDPDDEEVKEVMEKLNVLTSDDNEGNEVIKKIVVLTRRLHSFTGINKDLPSCRRLRYDFMLECNNILDHKMALYDKVRYLSSLHRSTDDKIKALVDMIEKTNENSEQNKSIQTKQCLTNRERKELKKKFDAEMTNWIKANWINPYPDQNDKDHDLEKIATDCKEEMKTVYNWLVNFRSRKWRDAIGKALEKERPSELLEEDSIRIFEKKPLRVLQPGKRKMS